MADLSDLAILGTGLVTLIGGGWTLWNYINSRQGKPAIVTKVTCRMLDYEDKQGSQVAEIKLYIKNTGGSRCNIKGIFISVRGLGENDKITSAGPLQQAYFPISIASKRRAFPEDWKYSYVDPGQQAIYKHLAKVPAGMGLIHIHAKVKCDDPELEFVTASHTVRV
jgi:hypothetical protein